ncbi:hypothetical protein BKA01_006989 [Pseudonocardia eucalypti]|nr:hypothetical protein [Pseudonocardia eucalypti]
MSTRHDRRPDRATGGGAVVGVWGRGLHSRPVLLFAFAFAVMADPVSSVAYAIEAALRALGGELALLVPTMGLVVAVIAVVVANYLQIVGRYPRGGGAAAATGEAFGEGVAFVPIGALIVDFTLTIAISCAAGASALIAYLPALAGWRVVLALGLVAVVAAGTWFGHVGRAVFALLTTGFVVLAAAVLVFGATAHPTAHSSAQPAIPATAAGVASHGPVLAVALAFPVAMALATGVEAPSSAIAQLGQLDDPGRRRFGRVTLWATLLIVATLTLGLAAEAARLGIGVPTAESTQIAELARAVAPYGVFAAFQLVTAMLLLSAASSSFAAGPGLLNALARYRHRDGHHSGILPGWLGRTNHHHTPYWGVVVFALTSAAVVVAAGGLDQELVLFYAVSVFVSFLAGLCAMARFSLTARSWSQLALNLLGALAVVFTLAVNLTRPDAVVSLTAALALAAGLYWAWVRAGRPRGVRDAVANAETETEPAA